MAYLRGDYYAGDYYAGDVFSFFRRAGRAVIKTVGGAALGFVTGGGIKGAIGGAAAGAGEATRENVRDVTLEAGPSGTAYTPALRKAHAAAIERAAGRALPTGTRHALIRAPTKTMKVSHVAPDGTVVMVAHRRRMNVTNPRALRRALRRVAGFGKLAQRMRKGVARAAAAVGVRHRVARGKAIARRR